MLSGIKFISRDQIDSDKGGDLGGNEKDKYGKSSTKRAKNRSEKSNSKYDSSDDEGLDKIKKRSRNRKWYSSDECSESSSGEEDGSDSGGGDSGEKRRRKRKGRSRDKVEKKEKKKSSRSKSKKNASEDSSSDTAEDERRPKRVGKSKSRKKVRKVDDLDGEGGSSSGNNIDIVRKEMGLDWMLRPSDRPKKTTLEELPMEPPKEESLKANPKEMNPYWRDNGMGCPEVANQPKSSHKELLSSSLVGDGGASWRLKALKRAKEQAEREGRDLKDVVQDRWGDLGHLAVSVSSRSAAAPRAHLRAIQSRKVGANDGTDSNSVNESERHEKDTGRDYLKDVSLRHPEMKAPRARDSLSWGKGKRPNIHNKDAALISSAISSINKFANDGNFMSEITNQQNKFEFSSSQDAPKRVETREAEGSTAVSESSEQKPQLSANQLAAKAMQLRLKGKHEEADKLLKEADRARVDGQSTEDKITKIRNDVSSSRYAAQEKSLRQKGKEDDSDIHLAQTIMKNKLYNSATQADDEYEYGGAPSKKSKRKGADRGNRLEVAKPSGKRIMTQQERCLYCFENPQRPKHLVVAIANFTYLMLPQFTPVASGHCCIVTLQHELATRMVDDDVWEEIRNFKKCLIMMFAKQGKEVIFLETVLWLAQQRRHCMIECIPLPQDLAKDAPLYFKKAIDEAESEWSQHDAKKLIDTSQKGLCNSIPKDFPYVHVEFGLNKGFVHVIDDESQFKSSFGLNVIRGMLQSQDEDMYRRRHYESLESQKQAVTEFAKDWAPFDWTKQLD